MAALLARGYSVGAIARCMKIPRRIIFRWKRVPAFATLFCECCNILGRVWPGERGACELYRERVSYDSIEDYSAAVKRVTPACNALLRSMRFP